MKVTKILPVHVDDRGEIADIFVNNPVEHVNVIVSVADARRGDHFHKLSTQWIYMVAGEMEYHWRNYEHDTEPKMVVVHANDLIETPAGEVHALYMRTPVTFLAFARGPRGGDGYEGDTYRVNPSIIVRERE